MEDRPKGQLKFHHVEYNQKSTLAIYIDIFFEDEDGTLWKMYASSFLFDLKKVK